MNRNKVALGLSGGVDSAVAAYLFKSYGYDVHCIYLNCFDSDIPGCRGDQDRKDALAVAMNLDLPFQVLDFRRQYKASVIDYFKKEYLAGRTPNPDVVCNRDIKFGLFLDWCIKNGFDYVATGHYADVAEILPGQNFAATPAPAEKRAMSRERIVLRQLAEGEWQAKAGATILRIPKDKHKDQTYFLWAVPAEKFSRVLFPLGDLLKSEVREIAWKAGLVVADKRDSTGICFVGEISAAEFLKRLGVKEKEGEVVVMVCQFQNTQNTRIAGKSPVLDQVETRSGDSRKLRKSEILNPILRHSGSPTLRSSEFSEFSEHIHSDSCYRVIGRHRGVWFYTIGQRHGFDVTKWLSASSRHPERSDPERSQGGAESKDIPPLYVIAKDVRKNRLVVGFGAECYGSQFRCGQLNWQMSNDEFRMMNGKSAIQHSTFSIQHCLVRIRHGGELIPCELSVAGRQLLVALATPARGIAAGQSAVFYSSDGVVLGGGVIATKGETFCG